MWARNNFSPILHTFDPRGVLLSLGGSCLSMGVAAGFYGGGGRGVSSAPASWRLGGVWGGSWDRLAGGLAQSRLPGGARWGPRLPILCLLGGQWGERGP